MERSGMRGKPVPGLRRCAPPSGLRAVPHGLLLPALVRIPSRFFPQPRPRGGPMLARLPIRRTFLLGLAALALASAQPAAAHQKLVVYTANESNLNHFIFEAFAKETGIQVEPVEAGSGVLFRRIASEKEHPLGDIVWGVSRALLRSNKALLAPYASQNKAATPA